MFMINVIVNINIVNQFLTIKYIEISYIINVFIKLLTKKMIKLQNFEK